MASSMTAFTRQQSEHGWGTLVWEIRSVNHRYLEPGLRMPESLRYLEGKIREMLRGTLNRGKVEAQLKFTPNLAASTDFHLDEALLGQLVQAEGRIRESLNKVGEERAAPVNTLELLKWPGVIREQEQDQAAIEEATLALFRQSLDSLVESRRREGRELEEVVQRRLDGIESIVKDIRAAMPEILKRQRERVQAQFADLQMEAEPNRIEQEIVLLTQKADIQEEVDRLDTHVKEVRRILSQKGPVGRRLDFLMQELNREANTICSKAIVTETTLGAVELKVLIEQMREQIQNIE